ncbi:hypothetical protein ROE7235_03389 [Roseibaca ekhonensis]|jgi:hypothetical protein|uniref:Uncharacterized protein n=1 Tax=Roseinatronobacter ekhonensis TaxID=254356 RepID=A0A3B0N0Q6_9RHOB|nr:hypothetical protein [Roseibaca ekhonensis]SUZ33616.1 hypothetical protein ROE7235_03389 [Roseibaca ekhonensis]
MKPRDYIVTRAGWVAGVFRQASSVVRLTPEEAAYENVRPKPIRNPARTRRKAKGAS